MSSPGHIPDSSEHAEIPHGKTTLMSEQILALLDFIKDEPLKLSEIIEVLHGRAYLILLIILSLPFCMPIPLIGLSVPFGVVIALIGLRLALRQEPWLPERILRIGVPPKLARQLLTGMLKIVLKMEKLLRPRLTFLVDSPFWHHLYGGIICFCGCLLLLPLPIPFSNVLPAIPVILLSGALLERDGYFAIAGLLAFSVNVLFFGALFLGGAAVIHWLESWFSGVYDPNEEVPPPMLEKLLK